MSTEPDEEQRFVEEALPAVDADSAGHWPTVAGVLAVEVRRLRDEFEKCARLLADYPGMVPSGDVGWKIQNLLNGGKALFSEAEAARLGGECGNGGHVLGSKPGHCPACARNPIKQILS